MAQRGPQAVASPPRADTVQMPRTWIVTDGAAGAENQCTALAEAMRAPATILRVRLRWPWSIAAPAIPLPRRGGFEWSDPAALEPLGADWPDLVIASGRRGAAVALWIERRAHTRPRLVQIQDPRAARHRFDVLIVPRHDPVQGGNVIRTLGGLNRVSPASLSAAAPVWAERLAHVPKPRVAVLLGGPNKRFRFTDDVVARLTQSLRSLAQDGWGLLVTVSRRTPVDLARHVREALPQDRSHMWSGTGDNPYLGYLALADSIIVTADSVNMAAEAAATGRPVHVVRLDGRAGKFARFHADLEAAGIARPFSGRLEHWTYAPLQETRRVAAEVRERLSLERIDTAP